jgi:hypothetical protein
MDPRYRTGGVKRKRIAVRGSRPNLGPDIAAPLTIAEQLFYAVAPPVYKHLYRKNQQSVVQG